MISCSNGYQTPNTGNRSVQRTPANQNVIQTPTDKKCYNCGQKGHFAIASPNPCSRPPPTPTSNSAPPPNRNGNSSPVQSRQNYAQGRVNQLAMEEAQNALMNGTFLVFRSNHSLTFFLFCSDNLGVRFLLRGGGGSLVTPQNSKF
jgi:hypothetical protein